MENESKVKTVKVNGIEVRINDIHISKPKCEPTEVHLTFYADITWQTAERQEENADALEKQNVGNGPSEYNSVVQKIRDGLKLESLLAQTE